ncbi:MAG: tetratricopeptide repeat protein [Cyanothece sp. SIO1E1]|nr:tetratricopeptide repeat protein [Cyanothece sp. SIO1E1]
MQLTDSPILNQDIGTETTFQRIQGLNLQSYQHLKLALSLNLRRQIFVAVCDDLTLRNQLAARLQAELSHSEPANRQDPFSDQQTEVQPYPRFVSLRLNLNDPNPVAQIAQWLRQHPRPKGGMVRFAMPGFQILGIERLTRQPAAVQRLFLSYLQGIERNLPRLESSMLLWVSRPWFRSIQQSAPEFWRWRTGVFKFVGAPTSVNAVPFSPDEFNQQQFHHDDPAFDFDLDHTVSKPHSKSNVTPIHPPSPPARAAKQDTHASAADLWTILTQDLAKLGDPNVGDNPFEQPPAHHQSNSTEPLQPIADSALQAAEPLEIDLETEAIAPPVPAQTHPADAAQPPTQVVPPSEQTAQTAHPAFDPNSVADLADFILATAVQNHAGMEPSDPQANSELKHQIAASLSEPFQMLQQIEQLHLQQAAPATLAAAYRNLGNFYRDRIEQGESSQENLAIAIRAYEQGLHWLDENSTLQPDILNDLGNLYWMLSRQAAPSDQALPYLQQGVQSYQKALNKTNPETQPYTFAMIQNNLGAAYGDLARYQDPLEHLKKSVEAYTQALQYRQPAHEPLKYASTQNNLGAAYWNLAQYEQPATHLKQAIDAYDEALRYYKAEQDPLHYAMIQNNLGTAYWNLAQHEHPADLLDLAINLYQAALVHRTLEAAPAACAATQNNLATAYWHLANHHKEAPIARLGYWQQAIEAYEATLIAAERTLQNPRSTPLTFDVLATHNNLGLVHYQIATDNHSELKGEEKAAHLEQALQYHLYALEGWQQRPKLYETALNSVIQTVRAYYSECGLAGQNEALSKVPAHLLPNIIPKL